MLPISEIMMSVIPHLSRIAEKIMVRNWLLHFIRAHTLLDQFAFKPTGSTTAVLVLVLFPKKNMPATKIRNRKCYPRHIKSMLNRKAFLWKRILVAGMFFLGTHFSIAV